MFKKSMPTDVKTVYNKMTLKQKQEFISCMVERLMIENKAVAKQHLALKFREKLKKVWESVQEKGGEEKEFVETLDLYNKQQVLQKWMSALYKFLNWKFTHEFVVSESQKTKTVLELLATIKTTLSSGSNMGAKDKYFDDKAETVLNDLYAKFDADYQRQINQNLNDLKPLMQKSYIYYRYGHDKRLQMQYAYDKLRTSMHQRILEIIVDELLSSKLFPSIEFEFDVQTLERLRKIHRDNPKRQFRLPDYIKKASKRKRIAFVRAVLNKLNDARYKGSNGQDKEVWLGSLFRDKHIENPYMI